MRRLPMLAAMALLLVTPAARAGFLGTTMTAGYYTPDDTALYDRSVFTPTPFTVGPGLDTTGVIEGVTSLLVDFTDTTLTITFDTTLEGDRRWNSADFNGPIFKLVPPASSLGIIGFSVDPSTNMADFDASRVVVSDAQIGINWQGLVYSQADHTKVVINFTFANAVPEPSSIIALGAGCVLPVVATLRRRRRRAAA